MARKQGAKMADKHEVPTATPDVHPHKSKATPGGAYPVETPPLPPEKPQHKAGKKTHIACDTPLCSVIDALVAFEAEHDGKPAARLFLPRTLVWDMARLPISESGNLFHELHEKGPGGLTKLYGVLVTLTNETDVRVE